MTAKRSKLIFLFILGVMLTTFIAISCNNEKKDSTTPENKTDTMKMDTGTTRPVQPGD